MTSTPLSRLQACATAPHYFIPKRSDLQWVLADLERLTVACILSETYGADLCAKRDAAEAMLAEVEADRDRAAQAAEHWMAKFYAEQARRPEPTWSSLAISMALLPFATLAGFLLRAHG